MTSIEQIIKQSINPFDNFVSGNFWQEQQDAALTVESIHKEALTEIKSVLEQVANEHTTRTLILSGDSGVGKTYFLSRLKKTLNSQAFFAYIEPFPESTYIWRHILRYTVDSLVKAPDGKKDSQLLLWLRSCLSSIEGELKSEDKIFLETISQFGVKENSYHHNERKQFINILRKIFEASSIYNANEFFGILYNLSNPKLYSLSCEWLKGDILDEDSLQDLGVGRSIDNENAAQKLLANFSKLSAKTQPIVLCFDQLDNIARLPDNSIDLQSLFSVNSIIHNEKWQGLLVLISVITSTWNQNYKRIQPADLHRINLKISLKRIILDEAKALWATRLYPLHRQAQPQPSSDIYPLTIQSLKEEFPGGKALPRDVLTLGQQLIQTYKGGEIISDTDYFKLVWLNEFNKVQKKTTQIRHFSSVELIRMLQETLTALQVSAIQPKLLPSPTYAAYSFSYELPNSSKKKGIVWVEEPSMTTFCNVMKACHKVVQKNLCETLYLVRTTGVSNPDTVGNRIYTEIFTDSAHYRIQPGLTSVHYLETYHNLVNAAHASELVVSNKIISLAELEALIRASGIMHDCMLLTELGIFPNGTIKDKETEIKEFILNLVKREGLMGKKILIESVGRHFSQVQKLQAGQMIEQLCQSDFIQIVNPHSSEEEQLVCVVPKK